MQLYLAAERGDLSALQACLQAGAHPDCTPEPCGQTPLMRAAFAPSFECVAALLEAGADPNAGTRNGLTALCAAAQVGASDCCSALLIAGAVCRPHHWLQWTPLHIASQQGHIAVLAVLLAADREGALTKDFYGRTPLELALIAGGTSAARCLLSLGKSEPMSELLGLLGKHAGGQHGCLYAALATRQPLTAREWAAVPAPCPGLGEALPAVLERSAAEAALLVRHLPQADLKRLHIAALCLARAQRRHRLPHLPVPLQWRVLAESAAS